MIAFLVGLVFRVLGVAGMLAALLLGTYGALAWDERGVDAKRLVVMSVVLLVAGWLMAREGERRAGWRR